MPPETCHPRRATPGQSTPQDCVYTITAHQHSWWSAAVEWFEIYLLRFFFLPRTEEVNRHLNRKSPGLIVSQWLVRHFQWRTLDSGALFQGSPEWIHWPVGHSQAFTWRRNGWTGFVLELCTEKRKNYCTVVIWWTLCAHSVLGTYYWWNGNGMIGNTSCISPSPSSSLFWPQFSKVGLIYCSLKSVTHPTTIPKDSPSQKWKRTAECLIPSSHSIILWFGQWY